jgi:hypothetical protein
MDKPFISTGSSALAVIIQSRGTVEAPCVFWAFGSVLEKVALREGRIVTRHFDVLRVLGAIVELIVIDAIVMLHEGLARGDSK